MKESYDYAIIGAGMFGLYAARLAAKARKSALVIEMESAPFRRASYVNQARVHYGYHYPRSFSTAKKSAGYYDRFCGDFAYAINNRFDKVYAIASRYSLTSASQFERFCEKAGIPCEPVDAGKYFNENAVEAAFLTRECAFDAGKICGRMMRDCKASGRVDFAFNSRPAKADARGGKYEIALQDGKKVRAENVVNCTYASVNQVNEMFGFGKFRIKYEIAEVIKCAAGGELKNVGLTVMDGPFLSVMPFGLSGLHTLTAVTFTPHLTCREELPRFPCQGENPGCTPRCLQNCDTCPARPSTAWPYMSQMARKYLLPKTRLDYRGSLFAIKPILLSAEVDDSRPTLVRKFSEKPGYLSVLSGKINTIYDLDGVIA